MIDRLSNAYARCLSFLALLGCATLLAMMFIIVGDVALRNFEIAWLPGGLAWSNEISELMLYLITMCVAPWLLRQGQHIRVDILLQAVPPRIAWYMEWMGDLIGFACCLVIAWFGAQAAWSSYVSGAVNIKTLVTPEWWALAPLPFVFVLLGIEMIFRMIRLHRAHRGPRSDAVSAS
jgi:TRAP-type transport system small permease protein